MARIRRTAPGRALVLALALLGASLGGDHGAARAPAAGIAPSALVAGATGAASALSGVEGLGVDVNYCTVCAKAGSEMHQTG